MHLKIQQFVEDNLERAEYKFDDSVKQWAGWVNGLPGIYAQADSIELARRDLAEVIEEFVIVSLREKKKVKGLGLKPLPRYAKSH